MPARYSPTQQVLHWLTAVLVFTVLPVAWIATSLPKHTPEIRYWLDLHKLIGLSILALTIGRLLWRLVDKAPPLPASIGAWDRRLAKGVAGGLLIMLLVMPVSGYLGSMGHGFDIAPFDWFTVPRFFFKNEALGDFAKSVHLWGRWVVYSLIALHLGSISYHLIVRRDRLLERMLPRQNPPVDPE